MHAVRELPQYSVTIRELGIAHSTTTSDNAVDVEVDIQCSVLLEGASLSKSKAQRSRHYHDMTYILTLTSDLDFIDFRRIPLSRSSGKWIIHTYDASRSTKALQDPKSFTVTAQLRKPSQSIWVYMSSVSPTCYVHSVRVCDNNCRPLSQASPPARSTSLGLTRTSFLLWIPVQKPRWYEVRIRMRQR